jgi:hypothetical protein
MLALPAQPVTANRAKIQAEFRFPNAPVIIAIAITFSSAEACSAVAASYRLDPRCWGVNALLGAGLRKKLQAFG